MIIARPIADSAAAIVKINNENNSPIKSSRYTENIKKFKLIDNNNNSIENRIIIKLLLFIKIPITAIQNNQWLIKKWFNNISIIKL